MPQAITATTFDTDRPNPGVGYLLWLLCFVGFAGVHRFYTGRWGTGLLWLFTWGLIGIGQVIDLFLIPAMCKRPTWATTPTSTQA